jgi:hypothetical protein
MTSPSWFRGRAALAARLFLLAGTSYFLIATSDVSEVQRCPHPALDLTLWVTGTCGPSGNIKVTSLADECAIAVTGGAAVGLPSAGRFGYADGMESLAGSSWTLSGYLPESASPAGGAYQPDASLFAVVTDAQAGTGPGVAPAGSVPTSPNHLTSTLRSCSHEPGPAPSVSLACSGGGAAACQAVLSSQ